MKTSVYELLKHGDPQGLQNLWDYQVKYYGLKLQEPTDSTSPVTLELIPETLEEIDREMRKAPSGK